MFRPPYPLVVKAITDDQSVIAILMDDQGYHRQMKFSQETLAGFATGDKLLFNGMKFDRKDVVQKTLDLEPHVVDMFTKFFNSL